MCLHQPCKTDAPEPCVHLLYGFTRRTGALDVADDDASFASRSEKSSPSRRRSNLGFLPPRFFRIFAPDSPPPSPPLPSMLSARFDTAESGCAARNPGGAAAEAAEDTEAEDDAGCDIRMSFECLCSLVVLSAFATRAVGSFDSSTPCCTCPQRLGRATRSARTLRAGALGIDADGGAHALCKIINSILFSSSGKSEASRGTTSPSPIETVY